MTGKTINNYTIERSLGEGGMGNVYLARHNRVDRVVAIKVLHQNLFANESIRNRFKNEANALIKLEHPNIVKIYDYVEQDDFAGLIMEYIDGYTLDEYILKVSGPLVTSKAMHIISRVLDAVQYAHDNNIYHRDIKPGNIMVSKDGMMVRIMDFGIAKFMHNENFKNTRANTQLGTPFYMAPEQVKGLPYTGLSDIYSLGVTLFEMVTGKCPYQFITSLFELQNKIVNEPLPPTNTYYPDVSPRLQAAIIKATEKKPGHRFLSCKEFKTFLLADAEQNPGSSALHNTKLKSGSEKTKDQNIDPFPQPAGNISVTKNITPPNLLESYPAKQKKNKKGILVAAISLLLLFPGGVYFWTKKTDVIDDPTKRDSPVVKITVPVTGTQGGDTAFVNNDTTKKITASPFVQDPIPGIISDREVKNSPGPASPGFIRLTITQIRADLKNKVLCEGLIYTGEEQELKLVSTIPGPGDLKKLELDEKVPLTMIFKDDAEGVNCKLQVFYIRVKEGLKYDHIASY